MTKTNLVSSDIGYWEVNTPDTDSSTENNCKAPDECPEADYSRDPVPYSKVKQQTVSGHRAMNRS